MATDRPAWTTANQHYSRACGKQPSPMDERPFLFEALRELAFESCLQVAGNTLRIGLAVTQWQREQARILLEHFGTVAGRPGKPAAATLSHERAVALALNTTPNGCEARARAVITLRRDSAAGLALDARHHATLEQLRGRGARLVEVEHLAFAPKAPPEIVLAPMIQALASAVTDWDATDIMVESPRQHVSFYCSQLGFRRQQKLVGGSSYVLLRLPAARIADLCARTKSAR